MIRKVLPSLTSVRTTKAYDSFLKTLYMGAKRQVEEVEIPPIHVIRVTGNEPPAGTQFQNAIAVLYGIGYTLKMGLKFGKLTRPRGYFDYKVGALEALWWSVGRKLEITNPKTLRWQAHLMVPAFVTRKLVDEAREMAKAKHPEVPYDAGALETFEEGRSLQVLHVGPYDEERATIAELHAYAADHGLAVTGKHHEIYISDPRKTRPEKLRTVIRFGVRPAPGRKRR